MWPQNVGRKEVWSISTQAHHENLHLIKQYQRIMSNSLVPCFRIYSFPIHGNWCTPYCPVSHSHLGLQAYFTACLVWSISTLRENAP
jgi:hypothetical protein